MNEPVAQVVGAAAEDAAPLGLAPGRGGTDFVNRAQRRNSRLLLSLLGFTGISGLRPDRIGGVAALQEQHLSTGRIAQPGQLR
jgi:hypothetical protein